jgi:hypothetical protein
MVKLSLATVFKDDEVRWSFDQGIIAIAIGKGRFDANNQFIARNIWRLSPPGGRDLLNIDVAKENGRLLFIEIIAYSGVLSTFHADNVNVKRKEVGVPGFSLSLWEGEPTQINRKEISASIFPEDYPSLIYLWNKPNGPILYNIPEPFKLQLGDNELRVEFSSEEIMHQVIVGDKFTCEFGNADELCAIVLNKFDLKDQETIKKKMLRV